MNNFHLYRQIQKKKSSEYETDAIWKTKKKKNNS